MLRSSGEELDRKKERLWTIAWIHTEPERARKSTEAYANTAKAPNPLESNGERKESTVTGAFME